MIKSSIPAISCYFAFLILLSACSSDAVMNDNKPQALFELVPVSVSKLNFINRVRESPQQNVLTYEYFYNGAGVAVADFNGDDLPDIYLVSNLEDNALYLNRQDFSFQEVSKISKTTGTRGFSTGVSIVDVNADGRMDIYVCKSGRFTNPDLRRNELFVNKGNKADGIPVFEEQAAAYGLDISAYSTQAAFFDYDKDGDLDMFLLNHGIDTYDTKDLLTLKQTSSPLMGEMLFRNKDGKFVDVTKAAGIIHNKLGFGLGVGIGDLNNDNYPDVYVSNDYSGSDHLYINQKDGTFEEKIKDLTNQTSFYAMGNDIGDINNDGWQDIVNLDMVAAENYGIKTSMSAMNPKQFEALVEAGEHHQYMFNSLLLNNGIAQDGQLPFFSNIAQMAGISNTDWSWAPLLFDMDNDGWQDLLVTNGIKRNIRNNDAMRVVNQLNEQMMATGKQGANPQLIQQMLQQFPYHPKPNYFFRNTASLRFEDITTDLGFDSLYSVSSGAAYADFDGDGDLDVLVNNSEQPAFILKNNARNNALTVRLQGSAQNPFGIGTKVKLEYAGQMQSKEVYTSRGYQSSVAPVLHFGLGENTTIEKLEVIWSDGKVQELQNVDAGTLILDYQNAISPKMVKKQQARIFSATNTPIFSHQENEFDDFSREILLPHKMSNMGPASALGDVDSDGILDVFIGGAKGQAASLLLGKEDGSFRPSNQDFEKDYEDTAACFFDADSDGDLDLLVGSGSNEAAENDAAYQVRLYENDGTGNFNRNTLALLDIRVSAGVIKAADFDEDGDEDVFIGGGQIPNKYPYAADGYILKNESQNGNIQLVDATNEIAPFLADYGMVTDATWGDFDGDGRLDLVTVGEWMTARLLINNGTTFAEKTMESNLGDEKGWWYAIAAADFDGDGDLDLIAGNLGLNYKYKASKNQPFEIFTNDFDTNGSQDIVLSYYEGDELVPLRGRECSSNQMPFIKEKFQSYDAFGKATLQEVFGADELAASVHWEANNFAHCYFENTGNGIFEATPLPIATQLSSINAFAIEDFDGDGHLDVLCAGNLYGSEVETPRNDASFGHLLLGNGKGNFECLPFSKSGFRTKGEVRDLIVLENGQLIVIKNNGVSEVFGYENGHLE